MGLAVCALLVLAASVSVAAPAAAAPIAAANYGGGHLPERPRTTADVALVSVAVASDGARARVVGTLSVACGRSGTFQQFAVTRAIRPDGRLRFRAPSRPRRYAQTSPRRRGRVTVELTFDGAAASGSVRVVATELGTSRPCRRTLPIRLRAAAPDATPAASPTAGGVYLGTGDRRFRGSATPVALQVAPDARRTRVALLGIPLRCPGGFIDFLPNLSPPTRIRADGTFRRVERFGFRFIDGGGVRTRVVLEGRFTEQGVTGTMRASDVTRVRGKRPVRCRSGRIVFSAVR